MAQELNYRDAVTEIESFGIMPERPPSLEPMKRALAEAGLTDLVDPSRVIVVAGTNGKGSVSAMLAALIEDAGCRTGLYTSPHLMETTERIRIGSEDVAPERFAHAYNQVRDLVLSLKLSHFEVLTLLAAWLFFSGQEEPPVDYAVLEVGLGGLWDATNAIAHSHCVITALGMDHENLLGSSLARIAANKFGIVTPGARVVHAPLPAEALSEARGTQELTRSVWIEAPAVESRVEAGADGPRFSAETPWGRAGLTLPGARGASNAAIALQAFESLGFDPRAHLAALSRVRWPGRMERIRIRGAPCPIYLSGDHNPQGVASLLELLPHYPRQRLHLLVGVGKDKDLEGVLGPLSRIPDSVLNLTVTPFRGRSIEDYGGWIKRASIAEADPHRALQLVLSRARENELVLVTGSLYLVGEIRKAAIFDNVITVNIPSGILASS
jgi:dihydrofolate synthase/folylpolyglutamate synthase